MRPRLIRSLLVGAHVSKLLGQLFPHRARWTPVVDLEETDRGYLVVVDLTGLKQTDVAVDAFTPGVLTLDIMIIDWERRDQAKVPHGGERASGHFIRRLAIPRDVDQRRMAAEWSDGVLLVRMPKQPAGDPSLEARPRDISNRESQAARSRLKPPALATALSLSNAARISADD